MKPETAENHPSQKPSVWAIVQKHGQPYAHQLAAVLDRLVNPLSLRRKKYALVLSTCLPVLYCIVLIKGGWEKPAGPALPVQRLSIPKMQHDRRAAPRFKMSPDTGYYDSVYQAVKAYERKAAPVRDTAYSRADRIHSSKK